MLLTLRLLEVPFLHIAVSADLFGDRGERNGKRMILRREALKQFIDKRFVVADQLAFGAPFLGTPEQVERRAAQEAEFCHETESRHHPRAEGRLDRAALRVLAAHDRRREMELVAQVAFEGGRHLLRESAVGVEPRDLVFVLDREQLEIIARDGLGEALLAGGL